MWKYPLIMAHSWWDWFFKEHSLEAIRNSNVLKPDMIELDVRKSRDWVLYCYHGNIPFGFIWAYSGMFKRYSEMKKKIDWLMTLSEILEEINYPAIIYLDIKESSINAEDLDNVFQKYKDKFPLIYISWYRTTYLKRIKNEAKHSYKYAYQIPIFRVTSFLKKSERVLDMIKVWKWDKDKVNQLREYGYEVKLSSKFYSLLPYIKDSLKVQSAHICSWDVQSLRKMIDTIK